MNTMTKIKTKQDIINIVAKARDYLEAHKATNWTNWDEDGVVSKMKDNDGLLKNAIVNMFIVSYEEDDCEILPNEKHVEMMINEINDANTWDEEERKDYFEGYIGSYIKIA